VICEQEDGQLAEMREASAGSSDHDANLDPAAGALDASYRTIDNLVLIVPREEKRTN
jgi:hypothetical protein